MSGEIRTAVVYGTRAGPGGLGLQAATAIAALAREGPVVAIGPGRSAAWAPAGPAPGAECRWVPVPVVPPLPRPAVWLLTRARPGLLAYLTDRAFGLAAAARLAEFAPDRVYAFTQVGLEAAEWAHGRGLPLAVDNPNSHIRLYAEANRREWAKWVGGRHPGHPTDGMIARVERECALADRVRVSSEWSKRVAVGYGVPAAKVVVCDQPINLARFRPPADRRPGTGPLRIAFAGKLELRKGFPYLLRAVRSLGPGRARVELVGGTGDRACKALLARERAGLDVEVAPGDPAPAFHRAEVFVLPSVEDGFGFVTAEAMACGLPAIVTDHCGSAEWVEAGRSGWVVPAGSADALTAALEGALARRDELPAMGLAAREAVEARSRAADRASLAGLCFGPLAADAPAAPDCP